MRLVPAVALSAILAASPAVFSPAFAQDSQNSGAAATDQQSQQDLGAPEAPAPTPPAVDNPPTAPEPGNPIAASDVGPNVDRDLWCAIALSLSARSAEMRSDANAAMQDQQSSQVLFASVVVAMQGNGNTEQEFNQLSSEYTERMLNPFAEAGQTYTREECDAAVPEAQASIDAAAAAAGAAGQSGDMTSTDSAPPDAPSTPDAPAGDAPTADAPGTDGAADAAGPQTGNDASTTSSQ